MKKFRFISILFLSIVANISVLAQDTTFLDPKIQYFSKNGDSVRFDKSHRFKGYPRVKYSRELVRLNKDNYIIENCYYYDNKRYKNNFSTYFELKDDSIIVTKGETWFYKQINDSLFSVIKTDTDFIEKGTVNSLVPFIKHGEFLTFNTNNKLLVIEQFKHGKSIKVESPQRNLTDTICTHMDERPQFPSKYGSLIEYISKRLRRPEIAIESSISGKVYIKCLITDNGEITNITVLRSMDPSLDREALKVVANLPDFEPGKINGINVNSYYVIPVNFIIQ